MSATIEPIRPASPGDAALLVALALIWGSSFVFIKIAIADLPSLTVALARMSIACLIVLPVALARGQSWPRGRSTWGRLLFLGVFGNSLPFFLIGWGEQSTPSNLAAILMATIPIMVSVLAHFMTDDEKLSAGKAIGIGLGFLGVVILIGVDALRGLGQSVIGQLSILSATLCYALYGVNARKLPPLGSEMAVGVILGLGVLAVAPFWIVIDQPWTLAPGWRSMAGVLWLGVLSTALGNILSFTLLRRTGASFAAFNNYLVPLAGLVWGYALLGETPGWSALLALILILAGLGCARFLRIKSRRWAPAR
jgi:drug/metabolite transporter (DMT)-like permease